MELNRKYNSSQRHQIGTDLNMFRIDRPSVTESQKASGFKMYNQQVGLADIGSSYQGVNSPTTPDGMFNGSKMGSSKYNVYNQDV